MNSKYLDAIKSHYENCWDNVSTQLHWNKGPIGDLPPGFSILCFQPIVRNMWTYATCGMSCPSDDFPLEIHLHAPDKNDSLVELLTIIAHYHRTTSYLGLGHSVNFGRPWWVGSLCDRGLISLPYLDGPSLERLRLDGKESNFLWLIPVTSKEIEYKKTQGLEALEERLEEASFNYLDPGRQSVV